MKIIRLCLWLIGLAVALVLAFYLAHPVMLSGYARLFHLQTATKDADAIICLSGGRTTRVGESLRLWNQGYAKKLFVTAEKAGNKEFSGLELSHLEFAQRVTERMKMDAGWEVIPSLSGGATSTFDEAEDALYYAGEKGWKRIIIVTDEFHTSRAHYAFEKIFERSGIEVQVAGVPNEIFSRYDWWESDKGIASYFLETIKYPVYLFWDSEPSVVSND